MDNVLNVSFQEKIPLYINKTIKINTNTFKESRLSNLVKAVYQEEKIQSEEG